jgi:tRNA pseudouridine32 synthase/23S rRNA pseudouridine746 synthase
MRQPQLVHESKGLLFVSKPPGLSFHSEGEEPGVLPLLRSMQATGEIDFGGRLYSVHRLDRVTSGLLMIAKSPDAAQQVSELLQTRRLHKYYCALSSRKPSKKQGTVSGDMARSRRGSWKLLRTRDNPAITRFMSQGIGTMPVAAEGGEDTTRQTVLRAFCCKPETGRTHQLRVALKCLGAPILGDPLYSNADEASLQERCFLHACALRIPAGCSHLSEGGAPSAVVHRPSTGAAWTSSSRFNEIWESWFAGRSGGIRSDESTWFEGTRIASRPCSRVEKEQGRL